ncbi:MAG: saccharopine dehydrogenase NADP-binding domain-containing protein, partial [Bacteroidota bacterium]
MSNRIMIIGAGGVGRVATIKCAQHPEVFEHIMLASRTVSKCEDIVADAKRRTGHQNLTTAQIDAE